MTGEINDFEFKLQFTFLIMITLGLLLVDHVGAPVVRIDPADEYILILVRYVPIDRYLKRMKGETEKGIRMRNGNDQDTQCGV